MIDNLKSELAKEIVAQFLENMQKLGFQKEEVISLLEETSKTEGEQDDITGM